MFTRSEAQFSSCCCFKLDHFYARGWHHACLIADERPSKTSLTVFLDGRAVHTVTKAKLRVRALQVCSLSHCCFGF